MPFGLGPLRIAEMSTGLFFALFEKGTGEISLIGFIAHLFAKITLYTDIFPTHRENRLTPNWAYWTG